MTHGKTKALTRWTFVSKVMSLLFHMLSRMVKAFLPRSKCLLISWLQCPDAVILEPPNQSLTVSPSICHEVMGQDTMILVFLFLGDVLITASIYRVMYSENNPIKKQEVDLNRHFSKKTHEVALVFLMKQKRLNYLDKTSLEECLF